MKKAKITAIILAVIALIYGAGYFYFTDHFYFQTNINGVKCDFLSAEQAIDKTTADLDAYSLTIKDAVTNMSVTAKDAGLRYDHTIQISRQLDLQDEALWFMEIFQPHDYNLMTKTIDDNKLQAFLNQLECMNPANPQKPVNCKIEYDEASKSYVFVDEIIGNTIIPEDFYKAVHDAMMNREAMLDLTTTKYYEQPQYKVAQGVVQDCKATLDKYMATVITLEDTNLKYVTTGEQIHNFLKIKKNFKIKFDKDKMKEYIRKEISPVFTTVGVTRKIHSPASGDFKISGGSYGWQVSLLMERDQMIKDIKEGAAVTRKPVYLQDAKQRKKNNDIGNSYVDVNIGKQHLYVVENGKITFDTAFVSGDASKGHDTDKGVYMIEFKKTNYEMRDYNVTVKYWLPFNTDVGEGFHDATWRSSFGGSIYEYNGSHGCVNLPYEAAKHLYNHLPVGFPVIVH